MIGVTCRCTLSLEGIKTVVRCQLLPGGYLLPQYVAVCILTCAQCFACYCALMQKHLDDQVAEKPAANPLSAGQDNLAADQYLPFAGGMHLIPACRVIKQPWKLSALHVQPLLLPLILAGVPDSQGADIDLSLSEDDLSHLIRYEWRVFVMQQQQEQRPCIKASCVCNNSS